MFSASLMIKSVSAALALASLSSVLAAPVPEVISLESRAVAVPSPAFVTYSDRFISGVLPPASDLAVCMNIISSFILLMLHTGLQRH